METFSQDIVIYFTSIVIALGIQFLAFFFSSHTLKVDLSSNTLKFSDHEDVLTKLPRWSYLNPLVTKKLESLESKSFLMALWDIQNFESLKSKLGVHQCNQTILDITSILKTQLPNRAWIARSGECRFVFIVSAWNERDLNFCISKCFDSLNELSLTRQIDTPSNLIAFDVLNESHPSLDSIFRSLHFTLIHAKENALSGLVKHESHISIDYEMEELIISHIEDALKTECFVINFQGKVDLKSKKVCGFEALTRWKSEPFNSMSPGYFVPIINRSRYMKDFNAHILALSMENFAEIQALYPTPLTLSLNISPLYLLHSQFPIEFERIAHEKKVSPKNIILEITEDVLIKDYEKAKHHINLLRPLGVQFSLDDFGTGFSSLSHLSYLDIQELKFDKSIVQTAINHQKTYMIINGIAKLAQNMGCTLVAEGIETEAHYHLAEKIGCHQVQGYYIDRPATLEGVKSKFLSRTIVP